MIKRWIVVIAVAVSGAVFPVANSVAGGAARAASVTGKWHLHTNDCFFGVCDYTLHLVQDGHHISGGAGSGISGSIHFPKITINYTGVSSEDDWSCAGTINAARSRITGTFTDGTGGSGFCKAHKL